MRGRKILFYFIYFFVFIHHSAAQLFRLSNTLTDNKPSATVFELKPDGSFLTEGDEEGNILLRNANDGTIIKKFTAHSQAINNIDFNSTGKLLVSTSLNGEIRVYDFDREQIRNRYKSEGEGMSFALFSIADGFIYYNNHAQLWKIRSDFHNDAENVFVSDKPITAAVITPDRSALIFSAGNYINVLNTRNDVIIQQVYTGADTVERLFLLPDNGLMSWSADGTINTWKTELGQIISGSNEHFRAGSSGNAAFSHDSKFMLSGNIGTWARYMNLKEHKVEQELFGHNGVVNAVAFSPDDKTIFTASKDLTIKVWKQGLDSVPKPSPQPAPPIVIKDSVKIVPVPKLLEVLPVVEMKSKDIPSKIMGRVVRKAKAIKVSKPTLDIYVFDNEVIDGDTLSLYFNGKWILKNYGVIKEKKKITLEFNKHSNNYLVLFAENLGTIPPNTAVVEYRDEKGNHIIRLSSDLSTCSAVNFEY